MSAAGRGAETLGRDDVQRLTRCGRECGPLDEHTRPTVGHPATVDVDPFSSGPSRDLGPEHSITREDGTSVARRWWRRLPVQLRGSGQFVNMAASITGVQRPRKHIHRGTRGLHPDHKSIVCVRGERLLGAGRLRRREGRASVRCGCGANQGHPSLDAMLREWVRADPADNVPGSGDRENAVAGAISQAAEAAKGRDVTSNRDSLTHVQHFNVSRRVGDACHSGSRRLRR